MKLANPLHSYACQLLPEQFTTHWEWKHYTHIVFTVTAMQVSEC